MHASNIEHNSQKTENRKHLYGERNIMSEITNYSFPVMYSPTSLDTMSIILTDMDGLSADSHMRIWRVDVNAEDGTFVCLMAKETDNAWRLYNTYEEVNARFNELHPVAIDDSSVFSTDREAFTENMKQMLDAFRIWYNRYVEEERMYEIQREIYELCCKRDHILPESTQVEVCVGGIFVNAEKIEEGYRLTSEDSPAETFLADDMLDALSYLPEYLAIPEVIEEESIRMRAVDGR